MYTVIYEPKYDGPKQAIVFDTQAEARECQSILCAARDGVLCAQVVEGDARFYPTGAVRPEFSGRV